MHGIELSAHLHYDATPFRSVNRRILKVEMISLNLRPFSSFLMMGVFFSLFRAYLNFIHQTMTLILFKIAYWREKVKTLPFCTHVIIDVIN